MEIKETTSNSKMLLKDSEDIEYVLEFQIEDNKIHFKIIENNVYAPFTFEESFSLEDFIERHAAFKACDNLEEVLYHLSNLYKNKKITLNNLGPKEERYLSFTVYDISIESNTQDFVLKLKMTSDKDKALADLYKIQKDQLELFRKIQELAQKNLPKEHPLKKSISDILNECKSKIVIN